MTGFNNDGKFVPSTPKTYTVLELRDQEVKKSPLSLAARSKVVNPHGSNYLSSWAETDIGEVSGYGPCSYSNKDCTCYVGSGYAPLYMSCPYCSNRNLSVWTHSGGGCYGPMYISESLYLQCKRCYTSAHWRNWQFSCSEHQGYQYASSFMSFKDALRLGLAMQAGNSQLQDLVARISIKLIEEARRS